MRFDSALGSFLLGAERVIEHAEKSGPAWFARVMFELIERITLIAALSFAAQKTKSGAAFALGAVASVALAMWLMAYLDGLFQLVFWPSYDELKSKWWRRAAYFNGYVFLILASSKLQHELGKIVSEIVASAGK
jgi:hypothetical protein